MPEQSDNQTNDPVNHVQSRPTAENSFATMEYWWKKKKGGDPSTAEFMKRFYGNLKRGVNKAEALREAKQWMIRSSYHTDEYGVVTKHNHPFYWAPFILIGAYK